VISCFLFFSLIFGSSKVNQLGGSFQLDVKVESLFLYALLVCLLC
jgi:hypothetical protein